MRNRRVRIVASFVVLALLVVASAIVWDLTAAGDFGRIADGMSKQEVESVLGPPAARPVRNRTRRAVRMGLGSAATEKAARFQRAKSRWPSKPRALPWAGTRCTFGAKASLSI